MFTLLLPITCPRRVAFSVLTTSCVEEVLKKPGKICFPRAYFCFTFTKVVKGGSWLIFAASEYIQSTACMNW